MTGYLHRDQAADQLPLAGPIKADCPDGCGRFGKPAKGGHVKGCPCPACSAGGNRKSGVDAQRAFQKKAGIKRSRYRTMDGNEESWRDWFRWEVKSGAQVRPVLTAYLKGKAQSEAQRPIGDDRPFAYGATHEGVHLVCVEAQVWADVVVPALVAAGA